MSVCGGGGGDGVSESDKQQGENAPNCKDRSRELRVEGPVADPGFSPGGDANSQKPIISPFFC